MRATLFTSSVMSHETLYSQKFSHPIAHWDVSNKLRILGATVFYSCDIIFFYMVVPLIKWSNQCSKRCWVVILLIPSLIRRYGGILLTVNFCWDLLLRFFSLYFACTVLKFVQMGCRTVQNCSLIDSEAVSLDNMLYWSRA